jgi:hypothetical protein
MEGAAELTSGRARHAKEISASLMARARVKHCERGSPGGKKKRVKPRAVPRGERVRCAGTGTWSAKKSADIEALPLELDRLASLTRHRTIAISPRH